MYITISELKRALFYSGMYFCFVLVQCRYSTRPFKGKVTNQWMTICYKYLDNSFTIHFVLLRAKKYFTSVCALSTPLYCIHSTDPILSLLL